MSIIKITHPLNLKTTVVNLKNGYYVASEHGYDGPFRTKDEAKEVMDDMLEFRDYIDELETLHR